jgi:hypothetical protein
MSRRLLLLNIPPFKSSPASPDRGGFLTRQGNPSGRSIEEALQGGIEINRKVEDIHVCGQDDI